MIKEEGTDPLLTQIEETFSIENVTKEFFNEYKELYLKLKDSLEKSIENDEIILQEFENKVIKTSDFAKNSWDKLFLFISCKRRDGLELKKEKNGHRPKRFLKIV